MVDVGVERRRYVVGKSLVAAQFGGERHDVDCAIGTGHPERPGAGFELDVVLGRLQHVGGRAPSLGNDLGARLDDGAAGRDQGA